MEILNFILGLGSTVMLPIIIFVFGLIMRAGFSKSFKSGVTIGIGFTGINLVITLLTDQLGPVAQAMTERLGLDLQVIDIGWPAMSSISWAWAAAGLMIPIGLVINFVMLTLKQKPVRHLRRTNVHGLDHRSCTWDFGRTED